MAQSEFSIIKQYFEQLTCKRDDVLLGIGDDCALLQCPQDHVTAVSIDTLVEGIHFFADVEPEALGHKSLAVGLSDLAAMGAIPAWFTLALTLPDVNEPWLQGFATGLAKLANQYDMQLVGGDTTRGPLCISIQVHGHVKAIKALRRDGAKVGDLIYVSGTVGDAGCGLQSKLNTLPELNVTEQSLDFLINRLEKPTPRVELGQNLAGIASSAIDISDGLLADLGHIVEKSSVGASITASKLPLSTAMKQLEPELAQQLALSSGDDYELCFTVPADKQNQLAEILSNCTQIGVITEQAGIYVVDDNGQEVKQKGAGYDHFTS